MVSFNTYLEKLFNAISKFLGLNLDKQNIKISMERIEEIDKKEKELIYQDGNVMCINKLAFNHVSFGYFSTNVLSDISFSICKPGLYSFVGKNGAGKTTLVRVLLRKSSVIMLDEVTSDLDGNIENIVISLLEELANSAIIINVCHRKKLVESSTYIFVIEENRGIVETGTHQELKEKKGRYNELF